MQRSTGNNSTRRALQSERTQSARDALRRRQKIKKARTVKRHVHYKRRKQLMEELKDSQKSDVIVAEGLQNPFIESDTEHEQTKKKKKKKKESLQNDQTKPENEPSNTEQNEQNERKEKKKYIPFEKELRQFEEFKKEREKEAAERRVRIEQREEMISNSRKKRNQKSRQYRQRTTTGQPRLGHKVESLLSRLQQEKKE